jgi:hypothetical protein
MPEQSRCSRPWYTTSCAGWPPTTCATTLQPTALVHEAYMRMVAQKMPDWECRSQFYGVAAHSDGSRSAQAVSQRSGAAGQEADGYAEFGGGIAGPLRIYRAAPGGTGTAACGVWCAFGAVRHPGEGAPVDAGPSASSRGRSRRGSATQAKPPAPPSRINSLRRRWGRHSPCRDFYHGLLGPNFDAETRAAWQAALQAITAAMQAG